MRIICLVITLLMTASAYAQEPLSDEKQILKLEDDWGRALQSRDRRILDRIVARDFTFIEPDGTVKKRAEYLADRSSDATVTESFVLADLEVRVFGNSALASGVATVRERRHEKRYRFRLRWKELWRKENGRWQVVASQATPVNPKWDIGFVITK